MRDPRFTDLSSDFEKEFEYYRETHPPVLSDYKHRTPAELAKDVTVAHDFIKKLIAEKDLIRRELIETEERFRTFKKWSIRAFLATWGAFGIVLKALLPYLIKGFMAK